MKLNGHVEVGLLSLLFALPALQALNAGPVQAQEQGTLPLPPTITVAPQGSTVVGASPAPNTQTPSGGGFFDWVGDSLSTAPAVTTLEINPAHPIVGTWRQQSFFGGPGDQTLTVRQYVSRPDGLLAMVEVTIDEKGIPHFATYSVKPGASSPLYTEETFAKFLLNGTKTKDTVSLRLVDRRTFSMAFAGKSSMKSTLTLSSDGLALTEEDEPAAGGAGARQTKAFRKQSVASFDPLQVAGGAPAAAPAANPSNPLLGTWKLSEELSRSKPESGSLTMFRAMDVGTDVFAIMSVRLTRIGLPTVEMAVVQYEGPGGLVLALPIYNPATMFVLIEKGAQPSTAVAYKRVDANTVEATLKSLASGQVGTVTTRKFSSTLMEFTESRKTINPQGQAAGETVTTYRRVGP